MDVFKTGGKIEKIFKFFIPSVIFFFLGWQVTKDWSQVSGYLQSIRLNYLILVFPLLLMIYPEGALCWWVLLRKLGIKVPFHKAIRIWIIANTSRYIPGKVWQYVGRVELLKREAGVDRPKGLISIIMEIFLVITTAGLVSLLMLPFIELQNLNKSFFIFLLPLSLIFLHPKISSFILNLIARFSKNRINLSYSLSFKQLISILPLYILNFLLNGLALYVLTLSLYGEHFSANASYMFAFSGFYAFSWAVGFLSFFAPGGLGITEITLSYLLSFVMPLSLASFITILYRFMLTISEFLVFALSLKLGGKSDR